MPAKFKNAVTSQIADFIEEIGLEIASAEIDREMFLPGIRVEKGKILVDEAKLTYPGDLLHEAGHLALASVAVRSNLSGEVAMPGGRMEPVEVSAIAWSYAAILHLGLDPSVVFHEGGYGVGSERLAFNFSLGVYIGVTGLQDAGLAAMGERARELGIPPFPHMIKWLKD